MISAIYTKIMTHVIKMEAGLDKLLTTTDTMKSPSVGEYYVKVNITFCE